MSDLKANSLSTIHQQNQPNAAAAAAATTVQMNQQAQHPGANLSQTTKTVTAGSTTQQVNQGKVKRNLTMKHKLLAKAIK